MRVEFIIDLRQEALNANRHIPWPVQRARARLLREKSLIMHKRALTLTGWHARRAHLTVYVAWPNRRRRDVANLMPTFKPLIDGAVDAGVLPDDNDEYLTGPDPRVLDSLSGIRYAARVTFDWRSE